jgi:hypothetical protein
MSDDRRPPPLFRRPETEGRERRDSDAPGWSPFERLALRKFEALDGRLEGQAKDLKEVALRIGMLELHRERVTGREDVRAKVSGWALGIVAAVLTGLVLLALRGATKP